MCVNNLPKVATQWDSGATRDSNRGRRILIPSALTTTPPSHTNKVINMLVDFLCLLLTVSCVRIACTKYLTGF